MFLVAIAISRYPYLYHVDTGAEKKSLCLSLGAEKWVDFVESKDIVADVMAAAGGQGPHAALVAVGHVRSTTFFVSSSRYLSDNICHA